jgi:hypothetical protein
MSAFSIESVMIVPLWSLITAVISQFPFRLFTYFQNSDQKLPSFHSTDHNVSCAVLHTFIALGCLKGTPWITWGFLNTSYICWFLCAYWPKTMPHPRKIQPAVFCFVQEYTCQSKFCTILYTVHLNSTPDLGNFMSKWQFFYNKYVLSTSTPNKLFTSQKTFLTHTDMLRIIP